MRRPLPAIAVATCLVAALGRIGPALAQAPLEGPYGYEFGRGGPEGPARGFRDFRYGPPPRPGDFDRPGRPGANRPEIWDQQHYGFGRHLRRPGF